MPPAISRSRSSATWNSISRAISRAWPSGRRTLRTRWYQATSCLLGSGELEDAPDALGQPCPALLLGRQLLASRASQYVETRLPFVLGGAPAPFDPTLLLEPMERGIERAL